MELLCNCDYDHSGAADPECYDCKGTGEVRFPTLQYEVNFANANAWEFTKLFTQDGEGAYCGTIKAEDMPTAIKKLKNAVLDTRRKDALLPILLWAEKNNKSVNWS